MVLSFSSNIQNIYHSIWFGALLKEIYLHSLYIFLHHHNNITYLIPAHKITHFPPEERGYLRIFIPTAHTYAGYVCTYVRMYTGYCRAPSGAPSNRVSVPRAFTWRFICSGHSPLYTASRACQNFANCSKMKIS